MTEKKESKALAINLSPGGTINPQTVGEAIEVAKMFAASGMVPKAYESNPGAILVAMQMGAELGLAPMQAIQNIAVINGRPSLWGDAMLALVASHPDCEDISEWVEGDTAYCRVKRRGRSIVERSFSMDDAKTAGLAKKPGPWTQYPKRMLQLRARGFALRDSFPDRLRGIQSAEETLDVVESEFIEAASRPGPLDPGVHSVKAPPPEPKQDLPAETEVVEPEAEPAPVAKQDMQAASPPPELRDAPELNEGETELLGMVARAETGAEIKVLTGELGKRKMGKIARETIWKAIKKRESEIMDGGQ